MIAILASFGNWMLKTFGVAGCCILLLLFYYEGVPGASKLKFPEDWPLVGGFGINDVPVIGGLTAGKVHSYAAEQVKLATADMVTKFERDVLAAQLAKERSDRLHADQMTTDASKRADAALRAKTDAGRALDARIKADTDPDGGRWTEEDEKWNAKR
ncbi:hypothetical protein G6L78_01500 [Agrobacterium rhizogenes]|nr:hypothetical protein [Rhizobium rhizogenes]